jgi:protein phosphatase
MTISNIASHTDIGRIREENQDVVNCHTDDHRPYGFFVLADGMGGYSGGAIAAQLVVDSVSRCLLAVPTDHFIGSSVEQQAEQLRTAVHHAIQAANQAVLQYKVDAPATLARMGSTLVLGVAWQQLLIVAHVGDSRAYLWNHGSLRQITKDHSLVQEMIDRGEITEELAQQSQFANVITQAMGIAETVEPDFAEFITDQDSVVMACSDGLSGYLSTQDIATELAQNLPLMESCYRMVEYANERGGKDNITVVLAELNPGG